MNGSGFSRRDLLPIAAVGAVGLGLTAMLRSRAPIGRDVSENVTARSILTDAALPGEGPVDADLTMAVFTDYQCGACRRAAPELAAAVRQDGRVRLLYKDWPIFGAVSEFAARVALAADRQGLYAPVHHALMAQPLPLDREKMHGAVVDAGGDWTRIERDIRDFDASITAALRRAQADAFALGLQGTPSFVIGSRLVVGARDRTVFQRAFAEARET